MQFMQLFLMVGKCFVKNTLSCFLNYIKPQNIALGQSLWMVPHASNWGYQLNLRRRRGKRHTIVMMFVRGVKSAVKEFLYYFYQRKSTGREFLFPPEPLWVKLLSRFPQSPSSQAC